MTWRLSWGFDQQAEQVRGTQQAKQFRRTLQVRGSTLRLAKQANRSEGPDRSGGRPGGATVRASPLFGPPTIHVEQQSVGLPTGPQDWMLVTAQEDWAALDRTIKCIYLQHFIHNNRAYK